MNFLAPDDDFRLRTLASIGSAMARLAYLAQLRNHGRYEHWGMARTYGDTAAQSAIAANHTRVFLDVLEMPLEELLRDTDAAVLRVLRERAADAVPAETAGGTATHLSFVLESLSLVMAAQVSSLQAA